MLMDVVSDNFTDADYSVTTGHNLTVTVDAIQAMDSGDKRAYVSCSRNGPTRQGLDFEHE